MLVGVTMYPLGMEGSFAQPVSEVIEEIERAKLRHQVTALETIVEGEWEEVMPVIHSAYRRVLEHHPRVLLELRIDEHEGAKDRLWESVRDVDRALGHPVAR